MPKDFAQPQTVNTLFEAQRIYNAGRNDERGEIINELIIADKNSVQSRHKTSLAKINARQLRAETGIPEKDVLRIDQAIPTPNGASEGFDWENFRKEAFATFIDTMALVLCLAGFALAIFLAMTFVPVDTGHGI